MVNIILNNAEIPNFKVKLKAILKIKPQFWTKVSFLLKLLKLRKIRGKDWGKLEWLFGGLMSRTRYKSSFSS